MFNKGDYVTRNSYNNDIVFKIVDIKGEMYYLKGVSVRLYADSPREDLVLCKNDVKEDDFRPSIADYRDLDRNEYFFLPGRVLQLDGDVEYLDKCMAFYEKNKVKAYGLYLAEDQMPIQVQSLLQKYNPDIFVKELGLDKFKAMELMSIEFL